MKKLLSFIIATFVVATMQAQSIPMTNADCSTDGALTGVSPWILPGFTITETLSHINPAQCGISNGALRIVGTTNGKQGETVIQTDKADISAFGTDKTYSFSCTVKAINASPVGNLNVNIQAFDANGATVAAATAFVGGAVTKLTNVIAAGSAVSIGANVKLNPTAGVAKLAYVLQVGKYITTDLYIDDFMLYYGDVPALTVTPPADLNFSTQAGVESTESSFTVSGASMTSNVMVYGGANLEFSQVSGTGFSQDTIKLIPAGDGSIASTTIYARIKSGVTVVPTVLDAKTGVYSVGAATSKVSVSNKAAGIKTIQFVATVSGFATTIPTVDSLTSTSVSAATKSIKITANSLTADLIVSAGSNLEIGTDTLFLSPVPTITLPSVGDTVYVRLKKGLPLGAIKDESTKLTITSTGFLTKSIQFIGNSIEATGITPVNVNNIKLVSSKGALNLYGVEAGKRIDIFNNLGQLVKSAIATENTSISIPSKGLYFVKIGSYSQKAIVK